MRAPTARGCTGAILAVGALAAATMVPRTLSDTPPEPYLPRVEEVACGVSIPCPRPGREEWFGRVRSQLAGRIPGLSERERVRLAMAIVEESQLAGLDPLLVLAVIEVESGYDPGARSPRGARGLMQLRPSTLRREAERSRLEGTDPHDPVLNVRAGVRYYRRLLRTFKSPELALMAYNAGPRRISGYLRAGAIPDRFRAYPRRVEAEVRRLRKALAIDGPAAVASRNEQAPVE